MANDPKDFLPCLKHIQTDPQPKLQKMQKYPQMILNNLSPRFCRQGYGVTWWANVDKSVIVQIFVNIQIRIGWINAFVANYFTIISHGFFVIAWKTIDWTVLLKMLRKTGLTQNNRFSVLRTEIVVVSRISGPNKKIFGNYFWFEALILKVRKFIAAFNFWHSIRTWTRKTIATIWRINNALIPFSITLIR